MSDSSSVAAATPSDLNQSVERLEGMETIKAEPCSSLPTLANLGTQIATTLTLCRPKIGITMEMKLTPELIDKILDRAHEIQNKNAQVVENARRIAQQLQQHEQDLADLAIPIDSVDDADDLVE